MAAGSYDVSHGAASATTASVPTIATPAANIRRPRRGDPKPVTSGSTTSHPRIDEPVDEVDDQVRRQHQRPGEEHGPGHERHVEVEDGLHREAPEARPV